jgi:hypothetical protein
MQPVFKSFWFNVSGFWFLVSRPQGLPKKSFKVSKFQIFKDSRVQRFKRSMVQEFKGSKVQEFNGSKVQRLKSQTEKQKFKTISFLPICMHCHPEQPALSLAKGSRRALFIFQCHPERSRRAFFTHN